MYKEAASRADLPLRERVEVVVTKGDKILIQKRDGYAEMPGGGIDPGEDHKQTARRETMEEAGAHIRNLKPAGTVESKWYAGIKDTDWGKELWEKYRGSKTYFYTAEVTDKPLKKPTSDEGDGWKGAKFMPAIDALKYLGTLDNSYGMKDYRDMQKAVIGQAIVKGCTT